MIDSKNKGLRKRRWLWAIGGMILLVGLWQLLANFYREEEKQLRRQMRETIKNKYPDKTAEFFDRFGWLYFEMDLETSGGADPNRKSVFWHDAPFKPGYHPHEIQLAVDLYGGVDDC